MTNNLKRCYEILGLNTDATSDQIKQAYRDLVKVWHPDRFGSDVRLQSKAQDKLKEINEAYERLTSPLNNFDASSVNSSAQEESEPKRRTASQTKESAAPPKPKTTTPFSNSKKPLVSVNNFILWLVVCAVVSFLLIVLMRSTEISRTIALISVLTCSIIGFVVSEIIPNRNGRKLLALSAAFAGAASGSCLGGVLYVYHSSQLILDVIGGDNLTNAGFGVLFKQILLTLICSAVFFAVFKLLSATRQINYWWAASSLCALLFIVMLAERTITSSSQAENVRSIMLQPREVVTPKIELTESENITRRRNDVEPFESAGSLNKSPSQRKSSGRTRSEPNAQEKRNAVMQWPPQKNAQSGKEGLFIYNEPEKED